MTFWQRHAGSLGHWLGSHIVAAILGWCIGRALAGG